MKKIYLILSALTMFVISCQSPEKVDSQNDSNSLDAVKSETILNVARNFDAFTSVASSKDGARNARIGDKEKTIRDITPFKDDQGNALYYVINYKQGGFVIVSAEKKTLPILAFSDSNEFPIGKELPNGIKETISSYSESIKKARLDNSTTDSRIVKEWERLSNTNAINEWVETARKSGGIKTSTEPVDPPCEDSQIYIGPFTPAWGQGANWNSQMPLQSTFGCTGLPNERAFTGCVATAMAEVMNYHHFPNSYNWSAMGATLSETARLMRDAANSVTTSYQCTATLTASSTNVAPGLINGFGYSSANYAAYNVNTIQNEILNFARPVILMGTRVNFGAHAWVCDGFYQYLPCGSMFTPMLYMNWGFEGSFNGFYSISTGFDPWGQSIYFTNLLMVSSIRP
ncbi:C10 family peptidase [Dyadobacter frigoris]|uniref:Spi protease inhibitor domain-containing protein n=1 Tax=Dyadobacter frigoris TaxID=2576211 RepID=A0A4U6CV50_9BACT|nr:C10 family peptidase [Dyadobacter frigoris]TKT88619.1 hypothetical protein FDK13_27120 [Dyadobacter frigoris]GLU54953.1 hypothetical protein Dfri01_44140 [Dyadobacter frigoris]